MSVKEIGQEEKWIRQEFFKRLMVDMGWEAV